MQRDQQVFELIKKEQERQENGIELIASENFASPQVIEAMGTVVCGRPTRQALLRGVRGS